MSIDFLSLNPSSSIELDYDLSGNPVYVGLAAPGTGVGAALWQIRKLTFDGSGNLLNVLWANGSTAFNSIWTNRAALAYS